MNAKTYGTFQRRLVCAALVIILLAFLPIRAFATGGNVSGAIEGTWTAAQGEVKAIVNRAYQHCEELLVRFRRELEITARYLLDHETMDADTFARVFDHPESEEFAPYAGGAEPAPEH